MLGAPRPGGGAVTAEAWSRGYGAAAVVRHPAKHGRLAADGVRLVRGDVRDPECVAAAARGHVAAVRAVSPFSGPERGFADLAPPSS
ncbi:NAD(P)H-binding protein [Streptomyces vietnamensis]|uniref:NAD(P)H-binding protein n=1 Tax=Streptomyces vietnamensis TaxID=362257 RepID=UPI000698FC18|nr:NAD(P)H-binding protein [Streptomyces vietnamensis]